MDTQTPKRDVTADRDVIEKVLTEYAAIRSLTAK